MNPDVMLFSAFLLVVGVVVLWKWITFPRFPKSEPKPDRSPRCSVVYCRNYADPRCGAVNCSMHCQCWCPRDCREQPRLRSIRGGRN